MVVGTSLFIVIIIIIIIIIITIIYFFTKRYGVEEDIGTSEFSFYYVSIFKNLQ